MNTVIDTEYNWAFGSKDGHLNLYVKGYSFKTNHFEYRLLGRIINVEKDTTFAIKGHTKGYCVQLASDNKSFGFTAYTAKQGDAKALLLGVFDRHDRLMKGEENVWQ